MESIFHKIPFLRITLAFAIGILLGVYVKISVLILLAIAIGLLLSLFWLKKKISYRHTSTFGFFAFMLFILLGSINHYFYNEKKEIPENTLLWGTLLEKPLEKENSYQCLIELHAKNNSKQIIDTKTLVYFEKSNKVKALKVGQQILINNPPSEITNFASPYSFNYKRYLNNKRIYKQLYLKTSHWETTPLTSNRLIVLAESFREKLLGIYKHHKLGKNETDILSALTLGFKRNLAPEVKQTFSAAGAMHVLAVSGLHVGIIYLLLNFIFGFLRKQKIGNLIFATMAILLLWIYAFITGLSPSILRSATMFSLLIISKCINRKTSIYNSLAVSALFLLVLNPNNLLEIGFQLSYSAVFGIVFLQPKLMKLVNTKTWLGKFFWNLLSVSIAAQIATFPLTAFYFNQFPVYFLLSNLIVIPAAMLLIPMGIALLLSSQVPILGESVAFSLKWITKGTYSILQWIEALPYSVLNISINSLELLFLSAFILSIFLFLSTPRATQLKLSLATLLLFCLAILYYNVQQLKTHEIIVFKDSKKPIIQLVTGHKNYVISELPIKDDSFIAKQLDDVVKKKRLHKSKYIISSGSFKDEYLYAKKNIFYFQNKTIILSAKPTSALPDCNTNFFIGSNFSKDEFIEHKNARFITTSASANLNVHSLKTDGVFNERWR